MAAATRPHPRVKHEARPHPKNHGFAGSLNRFWERRWVKPVAWSLFALFWLPLLLVILTVLGINPIFTYAVTKLGSNALKVPVTLDRASISFSGRLSLGHLQIHNPPGFTGPAAASFEEMYAEVPIRSVFSRQIDIPVLTVVRPVFNLEMGAPKQPSNWRVLMKNLSESLPRKDEPVKADGEKTFKIKDLKIINPIIRYRSPTFADGIDLDLKDVELKQIGNAPGSSSKTYMVLASILQALLTGGVKDKALPSDVRGALGTELSEASKDFGAALQGIK